MGAGMFRSPAAQSEHTIRRVQRVFEATTRNKPRARAMVKMLKLAIKPTYAVHLYSFGATVFCETILKDEPLGSAMRELAILTLLCLSLEPSVRRRMVSDADTIVLKTVCQALRHERPATATKYAAIALTHSLSRDQRNLEAIFKEPGLLDAVADAASYESQGSPLRNLACEVLARLSGTREYQTAVYLAFREEGPLILVEEMAARSVALEPVLRLYCNVAMHENNQRALAAEKVVVDSLSIMIRQGVGAGAGPPKTIRVIAMSFFLNLSSGSEALALRVALLPRVIQACVDQLKSTKVGPPDLVAIKLLHMMTIYHDCRKSLFLARGVADVLLVLSRTQVLARMAFINLTGAFELEDEAAIERTPLLGCDEMDDRIVELLRTWCLDNHTDESTFLGNGSSPSPKLKSSALSSVPLADLLGEHLPTVDITESDSESSQHEVEAKAPIDIERKSTLLSLSVLLRRPHHLSRLKTRIWPLILSALDAALAKNDVRIVSFAISCMQLLLRESDSVPLEAVLSLLGRIQEKVHPVWSLVRADAERLVSRLGDHGAGSTRLQPVIDMLQRVLDGKQKGSTRSLDVPLTSLTYSLDTATEDEIRTAGRSVMRMIPRALTKAVNDDDEYSLKRAIELYNKISEMDTPAPSPPVSSSLGVSAPKLTPSWKDRDWEREKLELAAAVKEITVKIDENKY